MVLGVKKTISLDNIVSQDLPEPIVTNNVICNLVVLEIMLMNLQSIDTEFFGNLTQDNTPYCILSRALIKYTAKKETE